MFSNDITTIKAIRRVNDNKGTDVTVLFVCFVALRPKSTAMVMAGRSVHLTTPIFWAYLNKWLTSNSCTYFGL